MQKDHKVTDIANEKGKILKWIQFQYALHRYSTIIMFKHKLTIEIKFTKLTLQNIIKK